jgi:hypothetical protein
MNLRSTLAIVTLVVLAAACKKEFDEPPVRTLPTGSVLTVAELRALFTGDPIRFRGDSSVYAVVTADEQNGNLYKNVYVQDHTGAIVLRLVNPGGLYQGDSIRIYLPGTTLSSYQNLLQLDSVNVDNNVVKQATLVPKAPETVTIAQLNQVYSPAWTNPWQAKLIRLEGVEFILSELGTTYADAVNQETLNKTLSDCDNTILVRNSGYANFANQQLPSGNGSFVGVVGQFGDDMQLFIRNINEVQLDNIDERCDPIPEPCPPASNVAEDFASGTSNVDLSLECWFNLATAGTRVWRGYSDAGQICAQATAFQSGNPADVAWLVSPTLQFTPGMSLSLRSQYAFWVDGQVPFKAFVSTNFNGSNASTANWTEITGATFANSPTHSFNTWVPSGQIPLDGFLPDGYTGSFVVAFRYTGSGPNGQTTNYRIDDVVIQ